MKNRVCKNCKKLLPEGYKKKYCQSCMNKFAQNTKMGFKATLGTIAGVAIFVITLGKIDPRK